MPLLPVKNKETNSYMKNSWNCFYFIFTKISGFSFFFKVTTKTAGNKDLTFPSFSL